MMTAPMKGHADEPVHVERPGDRRPLIVRAALFLLHIMALLLGAALVAWALGRVLTDRYPWSQWLWWMPTLGAMILALLGIVLALRPARRRRRRGRIVRWGIVLLALLIYFTAIEHRLLRPAPPHRPEAMRLAHWNMTQRQDTPVETLLAALDTFDADVWIITSPTWGLYQHLLRTQGQSGIHMTNFGPMLVATRLPIVRARPLVFGSSFLAGLVEIDASDHLGRTLVMTVVDLPSDPGLDRYATASEARQLLDNSKAPQPDIVVGDFNITRGSASLKKIFPGLRHAFDEAGHGHGATFPRKWPLYHIDHALLGPNVRAVSYELVDPGMSRHCAQIVEIVARR